MRGLNMLELTIPRAWLILFVSRIAEIPYCPIEVQPAGTQMLGSSGPDQLGQQFPERFGGGPVPE